MTIRSLLISSCIFVSFTSLARSEIRTTLESNVDNASESFPFKRVPQPAKNDAATDAIFTPIAGAVDAASGGIDKLHDGKLPTDADGPGDNFFFAAGDDGGRFVVDLKREISIKQINTYSWHTDSRGPQVYTVYGSDGKKAGFNPEPRDNDPAKVGWVKIAAVDTRPKSDGDKPIEDGEAMGGQYAASVADTSGAALGTYRYLLFIAQRTEDRDEFGNTFFSEIDVIDAAAKEASQPIASRESTATTAPIQVESKIATIDVTDEPDLEQWARTKLAPAMDEWYPKLVAMLPSEKYTAQKHVFIRFRSDMKGTPAWTGLDGVSCNTQWYRKNLQGEAVGATIHELVHVVQHYDNRRRRPATGQAEFEPNPGWLVEGIADYVRWYEFEPQSHGTDIRDPSKASFDASYRITANFLNYVTKKYDAKLVEKLNASMRQDKYSASLWKQYTGKTAEELGEEWKASLRAH